MIKTRLHLLDIMNQFWPSERCRERNKCNSFEVVSGNTLSGKGREYIKWKNSFSFDLPFVNEHCLAGEKASNFFRCFVVVEKIFVSNLSKFLIIHTRRFR